MEIESQKEEEQKCALTSTGLLMEGVEALWLSQSDSTKQIHKTGVVAQRIKEGMDFEELKNIGLLFVGPACFGSSSISPGLFNAFFRDHSRRKMAEDIRPRSSKAFSRHFRQSEHRLFITRSSDNGLSAEGIWDFGGSVTKNICLWTD